MSNEDNTSKYTVPNGPFKDVSANPGEIFSNTDDYSGREYRTWCTHARTRHFLEKFKPEDGWKVSVTQEYMGLSMDDAHARDTNGVIFQNPAWIFTATLLDKDNNQVANAAVTQLLNCPMSIEMGQTRARGKLYQSLGLPGSLNSEDESITGNTGPAKHDPSAPMNAIRPVVDHERDAAADRAQQQEESQVQTSSPQPTAEANDANDEAPAADASSGDDQVVQEEAEDSSNAESEHDLDSDPGLETVQVVPNSAPANAGITPSAAKAADATKIPSGIMNQIKHRAARAKVAVPNFNTVQEATDFLALLLNPKAGKDDLASGEQQ